MMSHRRALSWSSALRDLRDDRTRAPAGFVTARARCEGFGRWTRPLVAASGAFDRSAIMAAATAAARAHQERFGCPWGEAMSVCLKAAWQAARAARAARRH